MTRTITTLAATLCGIGVLAGAAFPAYAADVRDKLTPELIYDHCLAEGVGSETEGTFMLSGGQRLTGTILCTPEDLTAAKAMPLRHGDDEDDDRNDDDGGFEA